MKERPATMTKNKTRTPSASATHRMTQIEAAIKKLGAATVADIGRELNLNPETVRRYVRDLRDAKRIIEISQAAAHVQAVFGPLETDDDQEFDVSRSVTRSWRRGQCFRDVLVEALFGPARGAVQCG